MPCLYCTEAELSGIKLKRIKTCPKTNNRDNLIPGTTSRPRYFACLAWKVFNEITLSIVNRSFLKVSFYKTYGACQYNDNITVEVAVWKHGKKLEFKLRSILKLGNIYIDVGLLEVFANIPTKNHQKHLHLFISYFQQWVIWIIRYCSIIFTFIFLFIFAQTIIFGKFRHYACLTS